MMRLRIRGPHGVTTISLSDSTTVGELRNEIKAKSGVSLFDLKRGYPPQPLELDVYDEGTTLAEASINLNGEQLIVVQRDSQEQLQNPSRTDHSSPNADLRPPPVDAHSVSNRGSTQGTGKSSVPPKSSPPSKKAEDEAPEVSMPSRNATMMLRVMPSDNSCLFRAFSYLMFGPGIDSMHELRSLVASTIQSNPEKYSDAILGQSREEYCKWIQTEYSWGGYVELAILSQHFGTCVASINVQDGRVDLYNEEADKRCILVYSGIHYDAIAVSPNDSLGYGRKSAPDEDVKAFDSSDDVVLTTALDLCQVLRNRNYHVDVSAMGSSKFKCLVCGWTGEGMNDVSQHVSVTGHMEMSQA